MIGDSFLIFSLFLFLSLSFQFCFSLFGHSKYNSTILEGKAGTFDVRMGLLPYAIHFSFLAFFLLFFFF